MNKVIEKIKNDEILNSIIQNSQNAEIYLVGGTVRDFYLGNENFDKDIIVDKVNPEKFALMLAEKLDATYIPLDEENKIYRLVLKDKINYIDVAAMMGDSIEDDLMRRDFTINSIAVNLKSLDIIDVNKGIVDLKHKKIKHISEQNFVDDPLRLLRAFRFNSMLAFELDNELIDIIKKHVLELHSCSVERINYELLKLFSGEDADVALLQMDETGLLKEILPIIEELKKIPSNSHHHLDLFFHSIETVKQVQLLYSTSCHEVRAHLDRVDFGGCSRLAQLKLAAFLHDIGKPKTWTIEEGTGRHRFIKHDDIGSKMCVSLLKKDKFSKKQINYVVKMVKYHIYPSHVICSPELNDKIYMRFVRKMEDDAIDIIILATADRLSARGPAITEEIVQKNIAGLNKLLEYYLNIKDTLEPLPKLLSGDEIMKILKIAPSKELGNIIKALTEAQLSGDVFTIDDATAFIKKIYSK